MKHTLLKTVTFLWLLALWHPTHAQQWENIWPMSNSWEITYPAFHCADTGWVVAYRRLYYTTNGGETFQHVYQMPDSLVYDFDCQLAQVFSISGTTAYLRMIRMMGNRIYKTTDGGWTFSEWEFPSSVDFRNRIYISEDTVVAFQSDFTTGHASLIISTNGGLSWDVTSGEESINQGIFHFTKTLNGTIWAFGRANQNIYYSINSGLSWQSKPAVVENSNHVIQVSFLDEEKAVMLVRGKVNTNYVYWLYTTDDGFNTIKFSHNFADFFDCTRPVQIWYQKEDAIWMIHPSNVYRSTNTGDSFEVFQPLNIINVNYLHFRGNTGYFGGKTINPINDVVYKYVDSTVSISPFNVCGQNLVVYPNPAYNKINIRLPDIATGMYTVVITSLEGKTLWTSDILIDANNPNFAIPVHSLSTGVYFVRVSGYNYSETTKFIINR